LLVELAQSGKAGLALPIRTLPLSFVLAGPRAGGKAGLALPMRTRPLSEMTRGLSSVLAEIPFTLAIGSSQM
jgi:hypothetical protein